MRLAQATLFAVINYALGASDFVKIEIDNESLKLVPSPKSSAISQVFLPFYPI